MNSQYLRSPTQQTFSHGILALLSYHHGSGPENAFIDGRIGTSIGRDNLALRLPGADWVSESLRFLLRDTFNKALFAGCPPFSKRLW